MAASCFTLDARASVGTIIQPLVLISSSQTGEGSSNNVELGAGDFRGLLRDLQLYTLCKAVAAKE